MTVGITGGTGFIGSFLLGHLLSSNVGAVRVLSRSGASRIDSRAEIVCGDLATLDDCRRFVRELDVVYYLAHRNSPIDSDTDLPGDALSNTLPLLNFIEAVSQHGRRPHVVYFSSGGTIYRQRPFRIPFRETDECAPLCSYGIQKLTAEQYLRLAADKGCLTATVLRVSNGYGRLLPRSRMQGLIGVAVSDALQGRPIRVFGSLENVRDYIHVEDICRVCDLVSKPREPYAVFNVGSGVGHSVDEVLSAIEEGISRPLTRIHHPEVGRGLVAWSVLDVTKAGTVLGWEPKIFIRDGIGKMLSAAVTPHAQAAP